MRGRFSGRPSGLLALAGLAVFLLAFFLLRYPVRGFTTPMGPDGPVYLWWSRLASVQGLSIANWRPGVPALELTIGGTLHLSQVQVLAAFGGVFATIIGLASAALVKAGTERARWVAILAGLLAGTFAVNLAGGYFGNIVFAALLIAAAAALAATGDSRGTAAAAMLLAGGGLSHPMFFLVGIAILVLTAFALRKKNPVDARRTAIAVGASGATVGIGMLSMLAGARPLPVDTSADGFLRRAGLTGSLAAEYRDRLSHHIARYELWFSIPLAFWGRKVASGFTRQFLRMWIVVTLIGLIAALVSDQIPGLRMLSFAYALPILAALGLGRLAVKLPKAAAVVVVALLGGAMVFGSALTWFRERPYISPDQVAEVQRAVDMISGSPAGTPIVFIVDERNPDIVAFHVTDWGNIIRAVMPPDRIPDVHLYVGTRQNFEQGQPTTTGDEQHDAISRLYLNDIRSSTTNSAGTAIVCTLPAFNPAHAATYPGCSTETNGAIPAAHETPTHPTSPANSWGIVASGVAMLLLLGAAGYGWATALIRSASGNIGFTRMALSPAFGAAALTLVAIVADRVGLRLTGPVPALATLLAGLAGYLYAWRTRRIREQSLARGKPATKIDQ